MKFSRFTMVLLAGVVIGGVAAANAGTVVYSNDFSARTSVVKSEPGPWRTYEYTVNARLGYNYSDWNYGSHFYENMPWSDPGQQQDGWVHGGPGDSFPGSWVRTNAEEECPGDTTHRFGTFEYGVNHHAWCRVLQPIGNSFSNGVVRYTVDMRPPKWWGAAQNGNWQPLFRFYPAFRRDLRTPEFGAAVEENPCAIGFTWRGSTDSWDNTLVEGAYRCFRTADNPLYVGGMVEPGHWYRCLVTLDIDNATVDTSMYDMGGSVPSFDDALGTRVLYQDGPEGWRWPIDATRGPIDGIAFQVEGINSYGVITNMPCYTNIRVEWKAPGTDEFLCCYENDFTTCRKRTLTPMSATCEYPEITTAVGTTRSASCLSVMAADQFPASNDYSKSLTPGMVNDGSVLQPVGFDNWRRVADHNWSVATIASYDGDNKFRVTWPWGTGDTDGYAGPQGFFVQPLGEPITSGKVRLVADIHSPSNFWYTANSGIYVALGNRSLYTSYGVNAANCYIAYAGIGQNGSNCYPEMKTNGDWPNGKGACLCAYYHWYRAELIVDLDAREYTYKLYDIEGTTPDEPIYTRGNMLFAMLGATPDVGSFAFCAYGAGVAFGDEFLYDNVVVWKNWDETNATGDEIYRNDFSFRTRVSARVSEQLGDAPNLTTDVKDYWTTRVGDAEGILRALGDDDNPCACFYYSDENPYVMQDFGTEIRNGKLTFTADIRPPNVWHYSLAGREASVYVGGEKLAQGNAGYGRSIYGAAAMCFGFDGGGSDWDARISRYVAPYVMSGSATVYFEDGGSRMFVDSTHWYRFVAKFDVREKKVDVAIYDMGTMHPLPDTPLGTRIAEATDLDFVDETVEALSTVCLHAIGGRQNKPWQREDEGCIFIDNLKAELSPMGFSIIIR